LIYTNLIYGFVMPKIFHFSIFCLMLFFMSISCDLFPTRNNKTKLKPFEIQIEKTDRTYQGGHEYVDITVNKGDKDILAFDLLIAYDASALSFQTVTVGEIFEECAWEYFTYRYGANGNCGDDCPSGMLQLIGLTEINNGPIHPTCFGSAPFKLVTLDFLVSDDRTYECMYVPIRFFWTDCGDNAIVFQSPDDNHLDQYNDILGISRYVYDSDLNDITDKDFGSISYFGTPDSPCMEGENAPTRYIDFINGGVDIACADSIDARIGDINMNGIANEIADAILFSNYFVYGPSVFEHNQQLYDVSDVNWDGIPSDISDLVYQINIIRGDALPYEAVQGTDTAQVYIVDNKLRIWGAPIGAAYVVVEGNVTPQLIFDQMEFKYAYDDVNDLTRILVYSFDGEVFYGGDLINYGDGNLLSIELATDIGEKIFVEIRPINKN